MSFPSVPFANVGGSGSWGYRFPEGVFGPTDSLQVRLVERGLSWDTPFGTSPPFGLYELTDRASGATRQFLRVWMHGLDPSTHPTNPIEPHAATMMGAAERVFWVLRECGVRWVLIDASVGGINRALDTWDLVIPHDFFDDMKRLGRMPSGGFINIRQPFCPHLRAALYRSAGQELAGYSRLATTIAREPTYPKVVRRGVYVSTDGPWLETAAQIEDYQRRGFDIVGKSLVPEVQLARAIGTHLGSINPVVNPAEGLIDPDTQTAFSWSSATLHAIYREYGPIISRIVLGAIMAIQPDDPPCDCADRFPRGSSHDYHRFVER
jgi:5'-methylthioadenosine phosphorylase